MGKSKIPCEKRRWQSRSCAKTYPMVFVKVIQPVQYWSCTRNDILIQTPGLKILRSVENDSTVFEEEYGLAEIGEVGDREKRFGKILDDRSVDGYHTFDWKFNFSTRFGLNERVVGSTKGETTWLHVDKRSWWRCQGIWAHRFKCPDGALSLKSRGKSGSASHQIRVVTVIFICHLCVDDGVNFLDKSFDGTA